MQRNDLVRLEKNLRIVRDAITLAMAIMAVLIFVANKINHPLLPWTSDTIDSIAIAALVVSLFVNEIVRKGEYERYFRRMEHRYRLGLEAVRPQHNASVF